MDKIIWIWIAGRGTKGLEVNPPTGQLSPPRSARLWAKVFERDRSGGYVRAQRALLAIRLRCLAYRKAGISQAVEATLTELAGHV